MLAAEIQWTGTFSINFYGSFVPFWFVNPKLTVNASGVGTLTATMGGYDMANPSVRVLIPDTPNIVIANLPNVGGYSSPGFTAGTGYVGTAVTVPTGASPQTPPGAAYWGSWPQSYVNFHGVTGTTSYWYSSGGAADPKKPQEPITVAYNLAP